MGHSYLLYFCFRYEENNLKVGRKKTNLMFIGDGKGKTVISGGKSVFDKMTTFHTASFGKLSFYLSRFGMGRLVKLLVLTICLVLLSFHFLSSEKNCGS